MSINELEYQTGYTTDPRFSSSEEAPEEAPEEEEEAQDLPVKNRALIVGDSQAEGQIGAEFERQLKAAGFDVFRFAQKSVPGAHVSTELLSPNIKSIKPNLVVAIFGGNDSSVTTARNALTDMVKTCAYNDAYLITVGPGPAVEITNLADAKKKFPKYGITSPDFWINSEFGKEYNAKRKAISQAIDDFEATNLFAYGIYTNYDARSIQVPPQPDGLHIVNGASEIVAKILDISGYKDELPEPKAGPAASSASDMLRDPAYYADLDINDAGSDMADNIRRLKTKAQSANFPYQALVDAAAAKHGIPATMIKAVMGVESAYNPSIKGPLTRYGKAVGLMQLIPAAAADQGLKYDPESASDDPSVDERLDPTKAIDAGTAHLKAMYNKFGNWPQTLAGYNGGPARGPTPLDYAVDHGVSETKNYVKKAMILYHELGGTGYM